MPVQPLREQPFEQEMCKFFNRHNGLEVDLAYHVAVTADGTVWAANPRGVARLEGEQWQVIRHPDLLPGANGRCLVVDAQGSLWVGSSTGVARLKDGRWHHWYGEGAPTREIHDLAPDGKGGLWALMSHDGDLNFRDVWHCDGSKWQCWEVGGVRQDPTRIALDGKGTPYIVFLGKVLRLRGKRWSRVSLKAGRAKAITVAGAPDGSVWVGTSDGVIVLRDGAPERVIGRAEGMPVRAVQQIAFAPNGDVWFSHGVAASRLRGSSWRYYSPYTWFPGGRLNRITVAPDGTVWLAASEGVCRLKTETMTLAQKSALFEAAVPAEHMRYGFVMERVLAVADDPNSPWHWQVTDNDGSHTADYCAAECFRYAATKAEDARKNAREAVNGCLRLVRLPEKRGFLARSAFRKDETMVASVAGEWHESSDGQWLWKGDTSSDELDGHMFAYSVYYDLVADEQERRTIAAAVSDLIAGIAENGYVLLDLDGKHTRWGVWSPELLWSDHWQPQRKLNSLEMLSYLRTALHMTGDRKFDDAYRELVETHKYAETVRTSQLGTEPQSFSKFDDLLTFHAFYPILKYETDPTLRAIYLDALERFWQFVRPERTPLYTAMVNIFLEKNVDFEVLHEALAGHRLDRAARAVVNAVRQDLEWREVEGVRMLTKVLPSAERSHYQWHRNPYLSERPHAPNRIGYPTSFLLVYWLARYHGLLVPA